MVFWKWRRLKSLLTVSALCGALIVLLEGAVGAGGALLVFCFWALPFLVKVVHVVAGGGGGGSCPEGPAVAGPFEGLMDGIHFPSHHLTQGCHGVAHLG